MEEQLKASLNNAITAFNSNRAKILQLAFNAGGQEAVSGLEQKYDDLRQAYFDILKKQLNQNNAQYLQLITSANSEAAKLTTSINQLNNINDIINLVTSVVSLAGTVISVLGI